MKVTKAQKSQRSQAHRMLQSAYGISGHHTADEVKYDCGCVIPHEHKGGKFATKPCAKHVRALGWDPRGDDEKPPWVEMPT